MTHQDAKNQAMSVRWKTRTCSEGEKCWCRMIVPEIPIPNDEDLTVFIAGSGAIEKDFAEHIVLIHNICLPHEIC